MGSNKNNECAVLGCYLAMDLAFSTGELIVFFWCEIHGMKFRAEKDLELLTKRRLEKAERDVC